MNRIEIKNLVFDDMGQGNGKILDGSFYVENSLVEDELGIDTINFCVRYPAQGESDSSITKWPYGTVATYYQHNKLFGKYYLVEVERLSKYEYNFTLQSAIGLLDDTTHYGGMYQGEIADVVIKDIIGGKIPFTYKPIFSKIKIYGWLPVANRRENLKQVLFACGGCIKKNQNGDVYITTLDNTTPINVPDSRVLVGGRVKYNTQISRVEVTEHGYFKSDNTEAVKIFEGELSGQNFITPKGKEVMNAALVTWKEPYHSITFEGCELLNGEVDANYAIVKSTPKAVIMGKPYIHTEAIINKNKANYEGEEKVATVKDATLVSLSNSGSTAERVLAYYGNSNTLTADMVLEGEKPTHTIELTNQFGEKSIGFIKSIEGDFGNHVDSGEVEVVLNYKPPVVVGSRTLQSIAVTKPATQLDYAVGDYFNPSGLEVTATYDDGTTNILNVYGIEPQTALTAENTSITIVYTELGVTCKTSFAINVKNILRKIMITNPPDNVDYFEGDTFNPIGMEVTALYADGSKKIVPEGQYTFSPSGELQNTDETITITYVDTGITATTYQDISVGEAPNLIKIEIVTPPSKTEYKLGEFFNTEGMVVAAHYDNGTIRNIRGYIYSPAGALGKNDSIITVSYTKKGVTKTATTPITVIYLERIEITKPPAYTEYYEGNNFNKYGMVVEAVYSNGKRVVLDQNAYSITPSTLVCKDTEVIVSYTEQGITATAVQPVTVTYFPYDYTKSKVLTTSGTYHLSDLGATHRNLRIVTIGGGNGGNGGTNGDSGSDSRKVSINTGATGSQTSTPGRGGEGGKGGSAVNGAKFHSAEIILDDANQDIVINIGAGGKGGEVSSNFAGNVSGETGKPTTCIANGISVDSNNGAFNAEGYTDIFTQQVYALPGSAGTDGFAGGDGGGSGGGGSQGENSNDFSGGNGGQPKSNSQTRTEIENPPMTKKTREGSWKEKIRAGDMQDKIQGNTGYRIESDGRITAYGGATIGYKDTFTAEHFNPSTQETYKKKMNHYNPGTVYIDVKNDKAPTHANGTYKSEITEVYCKVGNQTWYNTSYMNASHLGTQERTITVERKYVYLEHERTVSTSCGGGGGGGASATSYGYDGSSGSGGIGGSASPALLPNNISYGSSGHSGSGGGGGGGAGGASASINGDNGYRGDSASMGGFSGGSGGSGSAGSDGVQGCVIIYYS